MKDYCKNHCKFRMWTENMDTKKIVGVSTIVECTQAIYITTGRT